MKKYLALGASVLIALVVTSMAMAHAEISPNVVKVKEDQLFSLIVPSEEEGVFTRMVQLTLPEGFEVESVVESPGWTRAISDGEKSTLIWVGGHVLEGEAALFQFVGSADAAKDYTLSVRQTYSGGTVVDWSGPEDSDTPAPVIEAKSSIGSGGGGTSTVTWIALALGGLGALLGLVALAGGRRELA